MTSLDYLPFEEPLFELDKKIIELEGLDQPSSLAIKEDIHRLKAEKHALLAELYKKLDAWE